MSDKDPNGLDQHESGAKLDDGKIRAALVLGSFSRALTAVAKVGTYGEAKYSANGWKEVENGINRYDDAMLRHWLVSKNGPELDPESRLPHLAHMAWNALAVLELYLLEESVEEAIAKWKNLLEEDSLQSIQKRQEQISEEELDLSTSPPSTPEEPQDVGVSQSIQLPEKYRFRAEKKTPSVTVSIADR